MPLLRSFFHKHQYTYKRSSPIYLINRAIALNQQFLYTREYMPVSPLLIKDLSFNFGTTPVLKNIQLEVKPGEIFALIGPNGAGKSTLFRIISGLLPLQSGEVIINGTSLSKDPHQAKQEQLLLTDDPTIYPYLTGEEFLHFHASLRDISQTTVAKELPKLVALFPGLAHLTEPIGELSRGNKQKIQIISALLTNPKLLLSDEPIVGLDPASIETFGKILQNYTKKGNSVILALHTLDFAQKYADRVGIITNGELVIVQDINKTDLYSLYQKHVTGHE
jgi:ABC-type multidrug transport system ATPase subunit